MSDGLRADSVVIGVGSPLMGDDGVGIVALERLRAGWRFEPYVELLDGGTWGMNLLPFIEGAEHVLILDAIDVGGSPGEIVELDREALPRHLSQKVSPHQIDLREVLALAELRESLPRDTAAIGVQPGRVEMTTDLSPAVEAAVAGLVERAAARVAGWGHVARPVALDTA